MTTVSPTMIESSKDPDSTKNGFTLSEKIGLAAFVAVPMVAVAGVSYALDQEPVTVLSVMKHAVQGLCTSVGAAIGCGVYVCGAEDQKGSRLKYVAGLLAAYVFSGSGVYGAISELTSPHEPTHTSVPLEKNRVVESPEEPLSLRIGGEMYRCEPVVR